MIDLLSLVVLLLTPHSYTAEATAFNHQHTGCRPYVEVHQGGDLIYSGYSDQLR